MAAWRLGHGGLVIRDRVSDVGTEDAGDDLVDTLRFEATDDLALVDRRQVDMRHEIAATGARGLHPIAGDAGAVADRHCGRERQAIATLTRAIDPGGEAGRLVGTQIGTGDGRIVIAAGALDLDRATAGGIRLDVLADMDIYHG